MSGTTEVHGRARFAPLRDPLPVTIRRAPLVSRRHREAGWVNGQSHERSVGKLSNQVEHCFDDQLGFSDDRQMVAVKLDNRPAQRLCLPGRLVVGVAEAQVRARPARPARRGRQRFWGASTFSDS
jgi:hypothetical protein